MDLLSRGKEHTRPGIPEWLALVVYTAVVAWEEIHHVPWADEAQSWLIARDSTLAQLFLNRLHYEATPGLWHLLLWAFAHLHGSYSGLHWLTAAIGIVTAWIILRYSPFSLPIRILLPLGFSFVLQTAVIARSYNLVPLLAFVLCMLLSARRPRPIAFALTAGLLANTSLFAALMSAGFVAAYVVVTMKRKTTADTTPISPARWAAAGVTVLLLWIAAAWTALPAPDLSYGMGPRLASHGAYVRLVSKVTGIAFAPVQVSALPQPSTPTPSPRASHRTPLDRLLTQALMASSIIFYTVSQSNLLAALFYLLSLLWVVRHKATWTLLPFAATFLGARFLGFSEHHIVLLWASLIAGLWMAVDAECHLKGTAKPSTWDNALGVVLLLVAVEQVCWTVSALRLETGGPFDGSRQTAMFIGQQGAGQPIAGFDFYTVAVNAYFENPVFFNQSSAFWPWSRLRDSDLKLAATIEKKPRFVVLGDSYFGQSMLVNQVEPAIAPGSQNGSVSAVPSILSYLVAHGYRQTHEFCGIQPAHFSYSEKICEEIWEPEATTRP